MKILALDLGKHTGWAFNSKDGLMYSEIVNKAKKNTGGYEYWSLMEWLDSFKCLYNIDKIDTVVYEKVVTHRGMIAAHRYGGYEAILQTWCLNNKIKLIPIEVPVIRKYVKSKVNLTTVKTVRSNYRDDGKSLTDTDRRLLLKKEKSMALATDIVGRVIVNDNMADAIVLLKYYIKEISR